MLAFIALFLFGFTLLAATIWYFKDVITKIFNTGERKKASSEQEDTIKDAEYRPVVNYPKTTFDANGKMYASEGVFTTSKVTQMLTGSDVETWGTARWENLPTKASPNSSEYEPKTVIYKVIEVKSFDTGSAVNTSELIATHADIDTIH